MGNVILYEEHRCILESDKKWLDDAIINAVQYLLHSQYGMPGFQATTLGYHLTFDIMRKGFIQILHNLEDHWFSQFQPLDCHQAMCTSMIVSITLILIMALNKFVPFFILLTMQCISISWMLINRLIIQTVACMPLRMLS